MHNYFPACRASCAIGTVSAILLRSDSKSNPCRLNTPFIYDKSFCTAANAAASLSIFLPMRSTHSSYPHDSTAVGRGFLFLKVFAAFSFGTASQKPNVNPLSNTGRKVISYFFTEKKSVAYVFGEGDILGEGGDAVEIKTAAYAFGEG